MANRPGHEPAHTAAPDTTLQLVHKFLVDRYRELACTHSHVSYSNPTLVTPSARASPGVYLPPAHCARKPGETHHRRKGVVPGAVAPAVVGKDVVAVPWGEGRGLVGCERGPQGDASVLVGTATAP